MIYVFLGQDLNIVKQKIDQLINKLNINNIIKYDGSECELDDILNEVSYVDLFNEKKLVLVTDFSFKKLKEKDEKLFIRYINNMNDNIIIFRCSDESLDERKSLTKELRAKCKIEEIKKLDYKSLHEYVTNMFVDNGIYVNYEKVKKILDLCEYDPDFTISEVEKLILYKTGENELTDNDIDNVISKNNEKEIFNFIENIMKKNIKEALNSFKILESSKIESMIIIDSLAKQFRLLYQIKLLNSMDDNNLSKTLQANIYVIKKLRVFVNSFSEREIQDILYKLSDCDIDIKINGRNSKDVLEKFIMTYTLR